MSEGTYRLVYFSRNHILGSPEDVAAEIRRILAVSQANNARAGVTGALMFNDGCFGQVLEGPLAAVEATFERIQLDDRHGEVTLLAFDPVEGRGFPNWSMTFVGSGEGGQERYGAIVAQSGFDPSRMSGDDLYAALTRLLVEDEAAAA